MSFQTIYKKLKVYTDKLNGSTLQFDLDMYKITLLKIKKHIFDLSNKSDLYITSQSVELLKRVREKETIEDLISFAYALVYIAVQRVLKITPFDVQLIGAIVLDNSKLVEMKTGEGKTITAVFPAYVNALTGRGVHILTFNDYLARRDANWMGPVYEFLGLNVSFIQEGMPIEKRKNAYNADITYLTAKEAGFDYLRDSLIYDANAKVQRPYNYAIIDEADSILIDEARVPLVIAGTYDNDADSVAQNNPLKLMAKLVRSLTLKKDYDYDPYARNIILTEEGTHQIEKTLQCGNIYDECNGELLMRFHYALHAEYLLKKNKDYIIRDNKVQLVDEFTGRIADNRRWPDGLQAAIEQKENLQVQANGKILNSISLQYFLNQYPKLCGMTATAQSSEEEFKAFYNLHIVVIPSNKSCQRVDLPDIVYKTRPDKWKAIVDKIMSVHSSGRPILVGTQSIEESDDLYRSLQERKVECNVLNAKNDEFEASIIAEAGKLGAITISTNMAGRGTDIRIGGHDEKERTKVIGLGGLFVIGTNKYESVRIDNQLRGRSGRQGDPGSTQFIISLEDDLFVKYRLKDLLPSRLNLGECSLIENASVNAEINRIQRIIEGQNLEIKKTICRYTHIIEDQRKILFTTRNSLLDNICLKTYMNELLPDSFDKIESRFRGEAFYAFCREICCLTIDRKWSEFLAAVNDVRDGIHLRQYGKQDPLYEYQKVAIEIFDDMVASIDNEICDELLEATKDTDKCLQKRRMKGPSATWTYLINDNPFEDKMLMQFIGDIGFSTWAGLLFPLTMLYFLFKQWARKKEANTFSIIKRE